MVEEINFLSISLPQLVEPVSWSDKWLILPIVDGMTPPMIDMVHRLNGLGSFFYFSKVILKKHRLTPSSNPLNTFHKDICNSLERDTLKEVFEIPRDHFKSTICSECFPMFRSLPFTELDEIYMRSLGYGNEFIRWMRHVHNQDSRSLLVSANIKNAAKLGRRIDFHYFNNKLFTGLYPEIIPEKSDVWAIESMTHRRTKTEKSAQGEGTYDFLGVGAALQSRHYDLIIEDDLVGLDALDSETVMQSVIDYHKLVVGAFDSTPGRPDLDGDEIVVGNRWQYEDLNSYLREFEPEFNFQSHDAEGGCCPVHPPATPIFPEEYSMGRLHRIESRLGPYFYSCQYRNKPTLPGKEKFQTSWLNWFHYDRYLEKSAGAYFINNQGIMKEEQEAYRVKIVHSVKDAKIIKDILPTHLERAMIIDPAHAGVNGRSRHVVLILGFNNDPPRLYLLDLWAKSDSYDELIENMYSLGEKWKIRVPYSEGVGFQNFLRYHFEATKKGRKADGKWTFDRVDVDTLKTDRSEDGKTKRIESMEPVYKRGEFWVAQSGTDAFLEEYKKYPYSKYKDVLDTLGYSNQLWSPGRMTQLEVQRWLQKNQAYRQGQSASITGY